MATFSPVNGRVIRVFKRLGGTVQTQLMDAVVALSASEGSVGDVMDATMMQDATKGGDLGTWNILNAPMTLTKLGAASGIPMVVPMEVPGVGIFDGASSYSIRFDCNNPAGVVPDGDFWEGFANSFPLDLPNRSVVLVVYIKMGSGRDPDSLISVNNDWVHVAGGRGYTVAQQVQDTGSDPGVLHTHGEADLGNNILGIDPDVIYEGVLFYDDVKARGSFLLLDGNTVMGVSDNGMPGISGPLVYTDIQNYLTNRIGYTDFYLAGWNWSNPQFPNRPITVPDVADIDLVQSNLGQLTLTFESVVTRFTIERSDDSGSSWDPIEEDFQIKTAFTPVKPFIQSGFTIGDTYRYRVKALIGETEANWVESADVTIAVFHGNWAGAVTGGSSLNAATGERGVKILIGASDVSITHLGCWFTGGTYANVFVRIRNSSLTIVGSATVLFSGSTPNAYNSAALSYTLLAGQEYYITRDVAAYNEFLGGTPTRSLNTSVATVVYPCDETGANIGGGNNLAGMQFTF